MISYIRLCSSAYDSYDCIAALRKEKCYYDGALGRIKYRHLSLHPLLRYSTDRTTTVLLRYTCENARNAWDSIEQ
jgi:hypothetical protein